MRVTVKGRIDHIFFTGNRWASILIIGNDGKKYRAAGAIDKPIAGYDITVEGEQHIHEVYGEQIKVTSSTVTQATSLFGITKYLVDQIKNIGPRMAERIVAEFGERTLSIIENEPERLLIISGISQSKLDKIVEGHKENKIYLELTDFLGQYATVNQIKKIYEEFRDEGIAKIKENPYIIIYRVDGIGFQIADRLAQSSGIKADDQRRVGAAIIYILKSIAAEGHCFCRLENLEMMLQDTFNSLPTDQVSDVLVKEIDSGNLVLVEEDKLYWRGIYQSECNCAGHIKTMLENESIVDTSDSVVDFAISDFEEKNSFELAQRQKDAVNLSMRNRLSVITGGPGSGKTTIIKCVIEAWCRAKINPLGYPHTSEDKRVILCAPTGKAARRMTEVTGVKASTIHRFIFHKGLKNDSLIVVDEASMLDIMIASQLLKKAVAYNCQLVLIGDVDQLSPIGPGNFFKDLLQSPRVPDVTLDITHRSSGTIAKNAQKINNGQDPLGFSYDENFVLHQVENDDVQEDVISTYISLTNKYGVKNVLCAVPKRKFGKSKTSSETLNNLIRERLNPQRKGSLTLAGCFFRENDRVMYLENNDRMEISNGDCGIVSKIDPKSRLVYVDFDCGKTVEMTADESKNMTLAYAMSVHKAQGSEFQAVIVTQCWEDYRMLSRALLYTAVTRAKEHVVLIGETRAIRASYEILMQN